MKLGRRAFLKGIVATGAAAAVPAFIIRREPDYAPAGFDDATVVKFDEAFTGESLFVPSKGESFSNLCSPTPLTRETFQRAIAEMKRQSRDIEIRPHVILVPPGDYAKWQAILDEMPPCKVERIPV